ncbi:MAG: 1,5-anhydro-D-fructose reductase [candidate division TA06 bacterium ADurb.Bin417]|uniref:1,5-anhydro-D-fructose reductase n=1 Tax=candidate division TA06 bacterium ADurb.Bin417 TaxID=1852828 RepID=A0A1V5MH41_UNCT6|nr:MAG: 1,5-anhydro-D-fructose reductase [candidate division TA06 bacterium ADurb.Bin417]
MGGGRKLNWGIIGCGALAERQLAPAIQAGANSRLAAVYSRDLARGEDFARRHGAGRAYDDLAAFLADPELEVVYIGTPPHLHCEQAVAASRAAGVKLMAGFMMRFNVYNRKAAELLRAGALGKLIHIRIQASYNLPDTSFNWRQDPTLAGGGSLFDMGSHAVDLLRFFNGEIASALAFVDNRAYAYPVEDTALALLRFAGGGYATLDASFSEKAPSRNIDIFGNQGSLWLTGSIGRNATGVLNGFLNGERKEFTLEPKHIYISEVEELGRAILEDRPPEVSGEDGWRNLLVLEAIYRSGREGRLVNL